MDVVRARVGSAVEWVVAALFLLATLAVASLVLRELRAAASASAPAPTAGVCGRGARRAARARGLGAAVAPG